MRSSAYVRELLPDDELLAWARNDSRIRPHGNPHYDEVWNLWAGGAEGLVNKFSWAYGNVNEARSCLGVK